MPVPSWERLDDFLQVDDFAVTAQVRPGGSGPARPVVGILDDPSQAVSGGSGGRGRAQFEVDAVRPTFRCKLADVAGVRRGDRLEVDGRTVDVLAPPHSDGTGMAVIELAFPVGP